MRHNEHNIAERIQKTGKIKEVNVCAIEQTIKNETSAKNKDSATQPNTPFLLVSL